MFPLPVPLSINLGTKNNHIPHTISSHALQSVHCALPHIISAYFVCSIYQCGPEEFNTVLCRKTVEGGS